jgi:S-adenosylmethionine hydrolase
MDCITLLSDFGLHDASVAYAKGVIMQYTSHLPIVDISHLIEPFHLQQAAYVLASCYNSFPKKTCHVALFDVFYEKEATMLLCEKNGQYFLAPDNGILSLAFDKTIDNVWSCHKLKAEDGFKNWLQKTGELLLKLDKSNPGDLGLTACELKNAPVHWLPKIEGNTVECHVIHIDRFENVVLNITRQQFEKIGANRNFMIQFMRDEEISHISKHYTDVKEGEKLCRFNTAGYLEIAINRGKAASLFGLKVHRDKHLMYNTIKIFFE